MIGLDVLKTVGSRSLDDDPRSGRPSTSTDGAHVTKVNEIVHSNRRLTVREIAEDCDILVVVRVMKSW